MGLLVVPDKMGEMVAKEGKESLLNWTGQDSVRQEQVLEAMEG